MMLGPPGRRALGPLGVDGLRIERGRPPPGPRTPVQRVAARRKADEDQPAIADRDPPVPVYIADMAGAAAPPGDHLDPGPRRTLQPISPTSPPPAIPLSAASPGIASPPVPISPPPPGP